MQLMGIFKLVSNCLRDSLSYLLHYYLNNKISSLNLVFINS